jgi:L-lactate dehydrogenase complex protein LldG
VSDARTEVLERITSALADAPPAVDVPRDYERALDPAVDIVELFAERVADYRATVHRTDATGLARVVAAVLAGWGVRRLVVPAGVPPAWLATAAGIDQIADQPPLSVQDLDAIDAVVTGCAIAIAETGTIVLDASAGQGRRALSLLPDRHLCVVDDARIVGTVPEALRRLDPARPQTWISGPSATSDIELERVEGVHGPRILDVVIVADAGGRMDDDGGERRASG